MPPKKRTLEVTAESDTEGVADITAESEGEEPIKKRVRFDKNAKTGEVTATTVSTEGGEKKGQQGNNKNGHQNHPNKNGHQNQSTPGHKFMTSTASGPSSRTLTVTMTSHPSSGEKRKADENAAGQPDAKRQKTDGEGEETKKKKKKRNKKNKNVFTSADDPLLEQAIKGTVPEGTTVPDRVRRKLPDDATRIRFNERKGNDHKWDAREELMFQKGGTEAQKVGDRVLPIYHAIAHADYSDELIVRMMQDYVAVHKEAIDGCWGKRAHGGDDGGYKHSYPPPLWFAVLHGRWAVVQKLVEMGARTGPKIRYANLKHLQGRPSTALQPCKWEKVPHERCAPNAQPCCDMYNYLMWDLDRLLKDPDAGCHADFETRLVRIESCMLELQTLRPDWIPTYDGSAKSGGGKNGKAFYIAPLFLAGFFHLLKRVQVADNMSRALARQHLDNFVQDVKRARFLRETLDWFATLEGGRSAPLTFNNVQRMLTNFLVKDKKDALVIGEADGRSTDVAAPNWTRVSLILAYLEARVPELHQLDDCKVEVATQVYLSWSREMGKVDAWFWDWLVRVKNAEERHKDKSITKHVTRLLCWQDRVREWIKDNNQRLEARQKEIDEKKAKEEAEKKAQQETEQEAEQEVEPESEPVDAERPEDEGISMVNYDAAEGVPDSLGA